MSAVRGQARALGVPFDGTPGPNNAIIDVRRVCVGHDQLSAGDTQTGVTAILPIGIDAKLGLDTFVMAAFFSLNGNGEMTGTHLIEETGFLEGPIMLTNTVSLGDVRSWVIRNAMAHPGTKVSPDDFGLIVPVVAETYDGYRHPWGTDGTGHAIRAAAPEPGLSAREASAEAEGTKEFDHRRHRDRRAAVAVPAQAAGPAPLTASRGPGPSRMTTRESSSSRSRPRTSTPPMRMRSPRRA